MKAIYIATQFQCEINCVDLKFKLFTYYIINILKQNRATMSDESNSEIAAQEASLENIRAALKDAKQLCQSLTLALPLHGPGQEFNMARGMLARCAGQKTVSFYHFDHHFQ